MYTSHFGFQNYPFGATPNANSFVSSETLHDVLNDVRFCIESGQGIAVVTGDAGVGKTTLCHKLAEELGSAYTSIILPNSNYSDRTALLQSILFELGRKYVRLGQQELRLELVSALRGLNRQGDHVVLLADEAETLSVDLLNELRTMASLTKDGQPLVRLVLSGQLALEEMLLKPGLAALNQRIRCQTWIPTMNHAESHDYIATQIRNAGQSVTNIFSDDALTLIVKASNGIPRCVNQLCNESLRMAFLAGEQQVSFESTRAALDELVQLPLQWNDPQGDRVTLSESTTQQETETTSSFVQSDDGQSAVFEIGAKEVSPTDSADEVEESQQTYVDSDEECETVSFAELQDDDFGSESETIEYSAADSSDTDSVQLDFSEDEVEEEEFPTAQTEDEYVASQSDDESEIYAIGSVANTDTVDEPQSVDMTPVAVIDNELRLADNDEDLEEIEAYQEVGADGFHEEVVFDRYAYIDAGRSNFIVDNDDVFDQFEDADSFEVDESNMVASYVSDELDIESVGFADEVEVAPTTVACEEDLVVCEQDADLLETNEQTDNFVDSVDEADTMLMDTVNESVTNDDASELVAFIDSDEEDCDTQDTVFEAMETDSELNEECDADEFEFPETVAITSQSDAESDAPLQLDEVDSNEEVSVAMSMDSDEADGELSVDEHDDEMQDDGEPMVAVIPNDEIYDVVEPAHSDADELHNRKYSNLFSRLKRLQQRQQKLDAS